MEANVLEYAIWNGKIVSAHDVNEYFDEKEIRLASGKGELLCMDECCENPRLKYRRGPKIGTPHFAHLKNSNCDYAKFDEEDTPQLKLLRQKIAETFKRKGYNVTTEKKLLKHHYTHIVLNLSETDLFAIEILTKKTTAVWIQNIINQYEEIGIPVKWIVADDYTLAAPENELAFSKRFCLNETKNRELIVVNFSGTDIAQIKKDYKDYVYGSRRFFDEKCRNMFQHHTTLEKLIFKDGELALENFDRKYEEWLNNKQYLFEKEVEKIKEKDQAEVDIITRRIAERQETYRRERNYSYKNSNQSSSSSKDKGLAKMRVKSSDNLLGKDVIYIELNPRTPRFGKVTLQEKNAAGQTLIRISLKEGTIIEDCLEKLVEEDRIKYNR